MKLPIKINERLTVGEQPKTDQDVKSIAQQGFRTVVNLRTVQEEDQPFTPQQEGEKIETLGMRYVHIPVSTKNIREEQIDQFREKLGQFPAPVFVHCATGKRSGAFAMMHAAVEKDMTGEETLRRAEQMGFECDTPELRELVKNYVDRKRA